MSKILLLSPNPGLLVPAVHQEEILTSMEVPAAWPDADWAISFGYRYLIGKPTIQKFRGQIINIHVGMLPWNRGADPNYWSFFDNTPKGITVHQVDSGLDTGPIYGQCDMRFNDGQTLKTSYEALQRAASLYFTSIWPDIRDGKLQPKDQPPGGTYRRSADKTPFMDHLPLGWDTPVSTIEELGRAYRGQTIASVP